MLLLLLGAAPALAESNLLQNGGFEQSDAGLPVLWAQDVWDSDAGVSKVTVASGQAHSGTSAALIESDKPNDAKWVQKVQVEPNHLYLLTGWIKAEAAGFEGKGANISVLGISETSADYKDTHGQWRQVELYGRTGPDQRELIVAVRLGGYGSLNTGKAYFDDIALEPIGSAPAGATVVPFAAEPDVPAQANTDQSADVSIFPELVGALLFIAFFLVIYIGLIRYKPLGRLPERAAAGRNAVLILAAGLLVRLALALHNAGHPTDMKTFIAWALHAANAGLPNFYKGDMFADYPPGYIYVLYAVGKLAGLLGFSADGKGMQVLVKLPAIIADLWICRKLYSTGLRLAGPRIALALAALYAFNPAVWVDSASWGQVDSVFTLVLLLALLELAADKPYRSAVLFAVTVLIKPQALIFTPVFLFPLLRSRRWKCLLRSILYAAGTFVLLIMPFAAGKPAGWIFSLYQTTLASYPYATLNAFNLFALSGGNWEPSHNHWLLLSYETWGTLFIAAIVGLAVFLYFKKNAGGEPGKLFGLALLLIVGVFVLGVKMHERYMYPALALSLFAYLFTKDRRLLTLFAGFAASQYMNVAYVLRFGERNQYFIPKLDGLLMLTSVLNVLLLAFLIHTGYDLWIKGRRVPVTELGSEEEERVVELAARWAPNPAAASAFAETVAGADGPLAGDQPAGGIARAGASPEAVAANRENGRLFTRKDWLALGCLVLVYSALALYHLGSFKDPQTFWQPQRSGESITIDFGEVRTLERMNSFGGVGEGKFNVAFSVDGTNWGNTVSVDQNYVKDFTWNSAALAAQARYARVTAESPELMLNEIAFYAKGESSPLAVQAWKAETGGQDGDNGLWHIGPPEAAAGTTAGAADGRASLHDNPWSIIDEPDKTVYKPSYMDGTYFDEIYHARTAYEHLHGIKPYENTHPPLGKLLIAVGIAVFGMVPFGWRIVGTLFGIGMIPIMYVFGKRLFGKTEYAFASAFLMTFDFMHFAQTRIATIDVYGVFFIMLMYYWMYRYYTTSFYEQPLRRTLWPLFGSGLFFGIGAASKWIAIYGGAGLAMLFFMSLYERYREYVAAKRLQAGQDAPADQSSRLPQNEAVREKCRHIIYTFPRSSIKTIAWCTLFFIAIPAVIYSLSFLPALTSKGEELSLHRLIQYQIDMYDYHTKLKATHAFSSPWYEWPFMVKPIWYYSGQFVSAGHISSIVSMGNPAVWWVGLIAVALAIYVAWRRKNRGMLVVLTAYFSQYVPWMLVPRLTFIYHYFAMVPFMILCIVYVMKDLEERLPSLKKWRRVYYALVLALFVMFYPILSGAEIGKWYADHVLRWFPTWYF